MRFASNQAQAASHPMGGQVHFMMIAWHEKNSTVPHRPSYSEASIAAHNPTLPNINGIEYAFLPC